MKRAFRSPLLLLHRMEEHGSAYPRYAKKWGVTEEVAKQRLAARFLYDFQRYIDLARANGWEMDKEDKEFYVDNLPSLTAAANGMRYIPPADRVDMARTPGS